MALPARTLKLAMALAILSALSVTAFAQAPAPGAAADQPAASNPASTNNEAFAKLRAQCEAASCSKGSGDVCVSAAELLLGEDPPDAYRDMDKTQKVRNALRILERGVDSSDRAKAKAYDIYAERGILSSFTNPNLDPFRAAELLEMMLKNGYPGGAVRKLQQALTFFGADKENTCKEAKAMRARKDLDADSIKILDEMSESFLCVGDKSKN